MKALRVLAIDTTSDSGSLALVEGDEVREEVLLQSSSAFAEVLFQGIGELMARHGWRYDQVDCFAAAAGPGSFTGVRVGLAAAKGLAEALGAKVAGVSNLMAIALHGTADVRAAFVDARRGEIYGAVLDARLAWIQEEVVALLPHWLAEVPSGAEFLTPDATRFGAALGDREVRGVPASLAGAVGRLAVRNMVDPVELDANYVRRSDGGLLWHDEAYPSRISESRTMK